MRVLEYQQSRFNLEQLSAHRKRYSRVVIISGMLLGENVNQDFAKHAT